MPKPHAGVPTTPSDVGIVEVVLEGVKEDDAERGRHERRRLSGSASAMARGF